MASLRRRLTQRGVSLLVGTASMALLIPSAGLAVDAALLYYTKARLQGAVDGAALGAARSLQLGATDATQVANAKQNAVNWFYANFPTTLWGTSNTQMDQSTVSVFDDPNNPRLRNVQVTANTTVPTIFMRWFNRSSTVVAAMGTASRRDTMMMMVLDRSGSMGATCSDLIDSAKLFTGQFETGRDRIGLVTFSDGVYMAQAPTTDFRNQLGFDDGLTSGTGDLDDIVCKGGTNTASAISLGHNELYKLNLPGAFNVLFLETDGLPNTLTMNFWDSTSSSYALDSASNCTDKNGRTIGGGGWVGSGAARDWNNTGGYNMGPSGYMGNIPAGAIGSIYSSDPNTSSPNTGSFIMMGKPWHTSSNAGLNADRVSNASGCAFASSATSNVSDIGSWLPVTDVYGNSLKPATNPYFSSVTTTGGKVDFSSTTNTAWTNYHKAALNATDNAAYRARTNAQIAPTVFVIGLGGNSGATGPPIDHTLLQRIANDPAADGFNSPPAYTSCATTANCVNYPTQPLGTYIYSTDANELRSAFLRLSSQILRLSK